MGLLTKYAIDFLKWWYCRWWVVKGRPFNIRDKMIHLLCLANGMYMGCIMADYIHVSNIWVIFSVFQLAFLKVVYEYLKKQSLDPEVLWLNQLDSIWDLTSDVAGMLVGWSLFHNFRFYSVTVALAVVFFLSLALHQVHFNVDGTNCLLYDRLYLLDDFPIPSGVVEDRLAVVDDWEYERITRFYSPQESSIKEE